MLEIRLKIILLLSGIRFGLFNNIIFIYMCDFPYMEGHYYL